MRQGILLICRAMRRLYANVQNRRLLSGLGLVWVRILLTRYLTRRRWFRLRSMRR